MLECLFHYSLERKNGLVLCCIFQRAELLRLLRYSSSVSSCSCKFPLRFSAIPLSQNHMLWLLIFHAHSPLCTAHSPQAQHLLPEAHVKKHKPFCIYNILQHTSAHANSFTPPQSLLHLHIPFGSKEKGDTVITNLCM